MNVKPVRKKAAGKLEGKRDEPLTVGDKTYKVRRLLLAKEAKTIRRWHLYVVAP